MFKKLPPSTQIFHKALGEIRSELTTYQVGVIQGPSLSGKSTLLYQLQSQMEEEGYTVALIKVTNQQIFLEQVLQEISDQFNVSLYLKCATSLSETFERLLEVLERQKSLILIDGIEHIQNAHVLFERFIGTRNTMLIGSCRKLPPIKPDTSLDLFVYRHRRFSIKELKEFVTRSRVPFEGSSSAIFQELYQQTGGKPFVLRILLGKLRLFQQPLRLDTIGHTLSLAKGAYVQHLLEDLPKEACELLSMASLCHYSRQLESHILRQLPETLQESLRELGILQIQYQEAIFVLEMKHLVTQKVSNRSECLKNLLTFINNRSNKLSQNDLEIETLLIYKRLGYNQKVLELYEKSCSKLLQSQGLKEIIEATEFIQERLSHRAFLCRQTLLYYRGEINTSIEEVKNRIKKATGHSAKRAVFYFALGKNYQHLNELGTAQEYVYQALEMAPAGSELYYDSLIKRIQLEYNQQASESCLSELLQIKKDICRQKISDLKLWGKLYAEMSEQHLRLGDFLKSITYSTNAKRCFEISGLLGPASVCAVNLYNAQYNSGDVRTALKKIEESKKEARLIGNNEIVRQCEVIEIFHDMNQGRWEKLKQKLPAHEQQSQTKGCTPFFRAWIALVKGDIDSSAQFIYSKHPSTGSILLTPRALEVLRGAFRYFSEKRDKRTAFSISSLRKHSSRNRLKLLNWIAEMNYQTNFLLEDFSELLNAYRSLLKLSHDFDDLTQAYFYFGLHRLVQNTSYDGEAEACFQEVLRRSEQCHWHFWSYRSLVFLALLELKRSQPAKAMERLNQAEKIRHDLHFPEEEMASFLKCLCYLLNGEQSMFEEQLINLHETSIVKSLMPFCLKPQKVGPEKTSRKKKFFWDRILTLLNIKSLRQYQLKNFQQQKTIYEDELPTQEIDSYDLLLNDSENWLQYKRKKILLHDKNTLKEILRLLIESQGEFLTKERIVAEIWQEKYHPQSHDFRIYSAIRRLRKLINYSLIQTKGGRYGLSQEVHCAILSMKTPYDALSKRQKWILRYCDQHSEVTRLKVQQMLKISQTLAKKEIQSLVTQGLLEIRGSGPASHYQRAASPL